MDGGATLQGKVTLGETSNLGPSILASGSQLLLAWTGTDNHLNLLRSSDGAHFASKVTSGETTHLSTAVAMCYGGPAFLWTGTDGHLNLLTV